MCSGDACQIANFSRAIFHFRAAVGVPVSGRSVVLVFYGRKTVFVAHIKNRIIVMPV